MKDDKLYLEYLLEPVQSLNVHEYMNLDLHIIWDTVQNRIPELKEKISGWMAM